MAGVKQKIAIFDLAGDQRNSGGNEVKDFVTACLKGIQSAKAMNGSGKRPIEEPSGQPSLAYMRLFSCCR
jgi:hypothetical protein